MKVIAEIGTAHAGSFEKAKALIDAAVEAGCDAVKFQWVYADEILHPDTGFVTLPGGKTRLYDRFKALEVPPAFFKDCLDYVHEKGAEFICSPFGLKSLEELLAIKPDALKIASPELNHIPLLKAVASWREDHTLPLIISSGVSTLADIEEALSITGTEEVTLLHCITSYPAPESEYNVSVLENLSRIFGVKTGISDHSLDPVLVPCLSAAFGSTMIEKHITLSRKTDGLDDPVALEGEQFAHMTFCLGQCEAVLRHYGKKRGKAEIISQMADQYGKEKVDSVIGSGIKRLAQSEQNNYGRTNRSIHAMRDIKKGETISSNDIAVLRTEKILTPGLHPRYMEAVTGATAQKDIRNGEGLSWDHLILK